MMTARLRPLMSKSEVAERCGVSTKTVEKWNKAGVLPRPIRVGKVLRWKAEEVEAWLLRMQTEAVS